MRCVSGEERLRRTWFRAVTGQAAITAVFDYTHSGAGRPGMAALLQAGELE